MAGIEAAVLGGGIAFGVAGYSNGTGFVARHETAHAQQVAEMKRIIADFEEAYKREEVSEQDWNRFLAIRNKARTNEADYEESIEDYKRTPVYKFIRKWKKSRQVRKKKGKLRSVNREMRLHYYDSTSDASDTSSIIAESGSPPPRSPCPNRYSDEDEERISSWANEVATDSDSEDHMDGEEKYEDCAIITWRPNFQLIKTISFSLDGQAVFTSGEKSICVSNVAEKTDVEKRLECPPSYSISEMTFSPDCARLGAMCRNSNILVWNAHTGRLLSNVRARDGTAYVLPNHHLAFTSDGRRVVSPDRDGVIKLWDIISQRLTFHPVKGIRPFSQIRPSSDGTRLAFQHRSRIWISDLDTGKNTSGPMRGHSHEITSIVFSSDDSLVVSGSSDKTIRIWDSRTGQAAFSELLLGHTASVRCIAISPDGRRITSESDDETIRIWDIRTGKILEASEPVQSHSDRIKCVAISPDGSKVASGSSIGKVRLWESSARERNKNAGTGPEEEGSK